MSWFDTPYNITVMEVYLSLQDQGKTKQEIHEAFGLGSYPIFDEAHREELNEKILKTYFQRKLGFETIALQKMMMDNFMNIEMPYFNDLYETKAKDINPLYDTDIKETYDGSESGSTISNGNETSKRTDDLTQKVTSTSSETFEDERGVTRKGTKTNEDSDNNFHKANNTEKTVTTNSGQDTTNDNGSVQHGLKTVVDDISVSGNYSMPQEGIDASSAWTDKYIDTGNKTNTDTTTTNSGTDTTTNASSTTYGHKVDDSVTINRTESDERTINRSEEWTDTTTNSGTTSTEKNGSDTTTNTGTVNNINEINRNDKKEGTNEYTKITQGYTGKSPFELIVKWREAIINIDKEIVNKCSQMFGCLW